MSAFSFVKEGQKKDMVSSVYLKRSPKISLFLSLFGV